MKNATTWTLLTFACISGFCWGCAGTTDTETASTDGGGAGAAEGPSIPSSMLGGIPGAGDAATGGQPPVPNHPAVQPPASQPGFDPNLPAGEGQRVRAEAGVGKQGQSLEGETGVGGMIAQPARTLFAVKQRAVFEIQIPSAVKLFQATEGRKPNSHDEFMTKIIAANRINLPELPAGQTYVYDPQQGELLVQKK